MNKVRTSGFLIDSSVLSRCKERLAQNNTTMQQLVNAAMFSYGCGSLEIMGMQLVSLNAIATKPVPSEKKDPVVKRAAGRPVKEPLPNWYEMDHSKRALKDFDFPDYVHPHVDIRKYLELDYDPKDDGESFTMYLMADYNEEREKWADQERMWMIDEYWNFCRCVAKKLFTLNKITNLRYDQMYLQDQLLILRDEQLEPMYQEFKRCATYYEKHGTLEGVNDI